jgi:adenylate cyclase
MRPRRRTQRRLLLGVVALAAIGLTLALRAVGALDALERSSVDARFKVRGDRPRRSDIVIVALDGRSVRDLGLRPPLAPRPIHTRLLRRLAASKPRLIAYDFQFFNASTPARDGPLAAAISAARPVVLATHDVDGPPLPVLADHRDVSQFGAVPGTVGLPADSDGSIRHTPYAGSQWLAFSVVAAETLRGAAEDRGDYPAWIDYRGPPGTYPRYSFSQVLRGQVPASAFRGKIVLVGATDPVYKDVFQTPPSDQPMPGVEIHANAIDTILARFPLVSAPAALDVALVVLLGLLVPLALLVVSAPKAVLTSGVGLVGLLVGDQLAFNAGSIVSFTYPALALVFGSAGGLATQFVTETRERTRMRRAFARFVPDRVIDDVMQRTDDDFRLGSATVEATVMFCDLRGFTPFAEGHSAATVIEALNSYLTEMSEAILDHGGTIVSYMGDGIMAVFGAPVEQRDHPDQALAAAIEMLETRLPAFNDWLRRRELGDAFRIGIGISTGPVRSGNVGSQRRLEYAAVGDTTNVAARLQGQCKHTPHQLLIDDATRRRLSEKAAALVLAGEYLLTGRTASTTAWTLADGAEPPESPSDAPVD